MSDEQIIDLRQRLIETSLERQGRIEELEAQLKTMIDPQIAENMVRLAEPMLSDALAAAEKRIEELTKDRDRWKDACRSASRDLNIIVPDNDRLKSERAAAEAKLAKAVEALEKLARLGNGDRYGNSDGNMVARAAIAAVGVKP